VSNIQHIFDHDFDNRDNFDHREIDKQSELDDVLLFINVDVDKCRKRRNDQIDTCDYEVNIHEIFSQFKKEHVFISLFCYDVVCIYHELSQIVRQKTRRDVLLFKAHQIQKTFRSVNSRVQNNVSSLVVHFASKHHDVFISCCDCFFQIFDCINV
jgi:hypothetical protein